MLITFLRHATAEEGSLSKADADRSLIDKGEKQVKRLAAFCQANQLIPGTIYSSPLLRAQQTATILNERLPGCPVPQIVDWLGTDTSVSTLLSELSKLAEQALDDVWLVGHEPDFSEFIARVLATAPYNIVVKKASLTRLDVDFSDVPTARLLWSVPNSLMRQK